MNKSAKKSILHSIVFDSREGKVSTIIEYAGDEFESRQDLINLASKTDFELNIELKGIYEYFDREEED